MKIIITIVLAVTLSLATGCASGTSPGHRINVWVAELINGTHRGTNAPVVVTNNVPADAVDITAVKIIGKHRMNPNAAKIVAELVNVKKYGRNKVTFNVTPAVHWPTVTGDNGKTTDGGVCILWREADGSLIGGFFDHHGLRQAQKGLENITGGYLDGRQPPDGAATFFYLINYAGTERTTAKPGGAW